MISYGDDGGVEGDNKGGGMLNSEMLGVFADVQMDGCRVAFALIDRQIGKYKHLNMIDDGDGNRQRDTNQRSHTRGFWINEQDETDGCGFVGVEAAGEDGGMVE